MSPKMTDFHLIPSSADDGTLRGFLFWEVFRQPSKMPLLSRRTAAQKSSLRSQEGLDSKASGGVNSNRGGRLPPRPPPTPHRRILFNRGFSTVSEERGRHSRPRSSPLLMRNFLEGKTSEKQRIGSGKKKTGFPLLFPGQAAIIMLSAVTRLPADARTKPKFGGAL